jgi:hypothetical protein
MKKGKETKNKITFKDESGYLSVIISGLWNIHVLEEYVLEVRQRLNQLGYKRVLIDNEELIHPGESSFDRYQIGVRIATEWGPYIKAAVITKPENISRYTETTAINRGANFAVFSDLEAAKKWLLS